MEIIIYFFIVLIAAVIGSFIGAITYRMPRGLGIVYGRSFCDDCHKPLGWVQNVPLISYLILGGKSYCCQKKISIRYFLIEFATVIAAIYLYSIVSFYFFLIYFILFLLCLSVLVIDLEHQLIPDELVWLILILSTLVIGNSPFQNILAGILAALFLLIINLLTKGQGMGLGDVKLAVVLGPWLGLYLSLIWIFGAFLTGGIVASILLLSGRAKWKQKIAFGPFLIISFLYVLFTKI